METTELTGTGDIARTIGIPEATLRYWRHIGYGPPSVKLGRRVYYRKDEVLNWIEQKFSEECEAEQGAA